MKVTLKISHKNNIREQSITLGQSLTVGRSSKCHFQVEDEKISGNHCRFFLKNDRLEITDLDSKNGTYLNGIRIEQSEVFVGDEVRLGDTVITCLEERFDQEALDVLTFPGPFKDRMNYELKADFTGARIQNQKANKKLSVIPKVNIEASHAKEVDLRRRVHSKIKLSKQEIRTRNKITSLLAFGLDAFVLFAILCIPILVTNKFVPDSMPKGERLIILLILEGVCISFFLLINFKMSKFTIGEKISGIESIYFKQ